MNFDLALSIDVLARTPGTLKAFLGGLAEPWVRGTEGPDTFSARPSGADLDLPGMHPTMGRVTLRELLATWSVHDLEHIAQIARVIAKQYGDQVGPWVPLLPILTDHPVPRS